MNQPLVSIGVPVYQGLPYLEQALATLLAQDYPNIEIIISDNASTDGTADYCRRMATAYSHITFLPQPTNAGPQRNFEITLEHARGKYMMWAAHDDHCNPQYVSSLVAKLEAAPTAVMATPTILHIDPDGTFRHDPPDRAAPGTSREANLKRLYHDHAASWVYGLYRMDWIRQRFNDIRGYPLWGGDIIWLAEIAQMHDITGASDAVLFKRLRKNSAAPRNARQTVAFWGTMLGHLWANAWRLQPTTATKLRGVYQAYQYMMKYHIGRPGGLRTAWRITRMLTLAALEWVPYAIARAIRPKAMVVATAKDDAATSATPLRKAA